MKIIIKILTKSIDGIENARIIKNRNDSSRDYYGYEGYWRKVDSEYYLLIFYCSKELSKREQVFLLENMIYAHENKNAGFTLQSIVENPLGYIGKLYKEKDEGTRIKNEAGRLFSVKTDLETREATLESLDDQVEALFSRASLL